VSLAWHTNVEYDRAGPGLLYLLYPAVPEYRSQLSHNQRQIGSIEHHVSIPMSVSTYVNGVSFQDSFGLSLYDSP
jgi:hypothetical protein